MLAVVLILALTVTCMAERGELHWLPVTYSMHGWERWVTLASCYIQYAWLREVSYTGFLLHTVCMAELHWLPVTYSMPGWESWVTLASCYIPYAFSMHGWERRIKLTSSFIQYEVLCCGSENHKGLALHFSRLLSKADSFPLNNKSQCQKTLLHRNEDGDGSFLTTYIVRYLIL